MSLHTHHYGAIRFTGKAWDGSNPAVHIDMHPEAPGLQLDLGYLALTPQQARILAHQLQVAAEQVECRLTRCDNVPRPEPLAA